MTCSSSRSARYRSLSSSRETSWKSFWTLYKNEIIFHVKLCKNGLETNWERTSSRSIASFILAQSSCLSCNSESMAFSRKGSGWFVPEWLLPELKNNQKIIINKSKHRWMNISIGESVQSKGVQHDRRRLWNGTQCVFPNLKCLPAWHAITCDTAALTVVFIAEFSATGARCSYCCRRNIRRASVWCCVAIAQCWRLQMMMWWILRLIIVCTSQIQCIQIGICVPGFKLKSIDILLKKNKIRRKKHKSRNTTKRKCVCVWVCVCVCGVCLWMKCNVLFQLSQPTNESFIDS